MWPATAAKAGMPSPARPRSGSRLPHRQARGFPPRRPGEPQKYLRKPRGGRVLCPVQVSLCLRGEIASVGASQRLFEQVRVQTAAKTFTTGSLPADFEALTLCRSKDCQKAAAVSKLHC